MNHKSIEEIRALYIAAYPHLRDIRNTRTFILNALQLMPPQEILPADIWYLTELYESRGGRRA